MAWDFGDGDVCCQRKRLSPIRRSDVPILDAGFCMRQGCFLRFVKTEVLRRHGTQRSVRVAAVNKLLAILAVD